MKDYHEKILTLKFFTKHLFNLFNFAILEKHTFLSFLYIYPLLLVTNLIPLKLFLL